MDSIQILMGVHEGAAFLPAQLASIAAQEDGAWVLVASDDSPGPASRAVLEDFGAAHPGRLRLSTGPRAGFAANYLQLLREAAPGPLALADQDDVWAPDKLARARAGLKEVPEDVPALYCARAQPWDGTAEVGQAFPPARVRPGFANALIENIAVGNTILLNAPAAALARAMAGRVDKVFAHDWWLYQLITGVGGRVIYDAGPPVLRYRQHGGNAIGAGQGLAAQLRRKRAVLGGAFGARLDLNAAALAAARAHLTPANARLFDAFEAARARPGPARLWALAQLGLYRQRPSGTLGFFGAAALGRA